MPNLVCAVRRRNFRSGCISKRVNQACGAIVAIAPNPKTKKMPNNFVGDRLVTNKEISLALGHPLLTVQKKMLNLQNQHKITKTKGAKYCQAQYADLYLANPLIDCACGCGEQFNKFDDSGRTRKYRPGHQFKR